MTSQYNLHSNERQMLYIRCAIMSAHYNDKSPPPRAVGRRVGRLQPARAHRLELRRRRVDVCIRGAGGRAGRAAERARSRHRRRAVSASASAGGRGWRWLQQTGAATLRPATHTRRRPPSPASPARAGARAGASPSCHPCPCQAGRAVGRLRVCGQPRGGGRRAHRGGRVKGGAM